MCFNKHVARRKPAQEPHTPGTAATRSLLGSAPVGDALATPLLTPVGGGLGVAPQTTAQSQLSPAPGGGGGKGKVTLVCPLEKAGAIF